jgi:hypothetical protein
MPATNNELEHLLARMRTEPIDPSRIGSGGAATTGLVLVWDGDHWVPAYIPDPLLPGAVKDLDGEPLIDFDGHAIYEPGDLGGGGGGGTATLDVYTHDQSVAASLWNVLHARGKNPVSVQVTGPDGNILEPTKQFPSVNSTWLRFGFATTGQAKLIFN